MALESQFSLKLDKTFRFPQLSKLDQILSIIQYFYIDHSSFLLKLYFRSTLIFISK